MPWLTTLLSDSFEILKHPPSAWCLGVRMCWDYPAAPYSQESTDTGSVPPHPSKVGKAQGNGKISMCRRIGLLQLSSMGGSICKKALSTQQWHKPSNI